MKKAMGIFALLMVALTVVGFAYAHWQDMLKINGMVETGSLTVGFTKILNYWDKEDYIKYQLGLPTKDVGSVVPSLDVVETDVHTGKIVFKKMHVLLNNTYGGYWGIVKFSIDNAGTVPAIIANVTITYDPAVLSVKEVVTNMVWEFTDVKEGKVVFNVWLYKEPIPMPPPWIPPEEFAAPPEALPGNQIDPQPEFVANPWPDMTSSELYTELYVHVKQSAPMCHTYYFDIEIGFVNWN